MPQGIRLVGFSRLVVSSANLPNNEGRDRIYDHISWAAAIVKQ